MVMLMNQSLFLKEKLQQMIIVIIIPTILCFCISVVRIGQYIYIYLLSLCM